MTQDEIKKALKMCANWAGCDDCPYIDGKYKTCVEGKLHKDALNLINEQEKEIEQLKANINQSQDQILETAQKNQEYREQQVKQAQLNILGKLWSNISNSKQLIQSHIADDSFTIEDIYMEIDELIAEVENEQKD